TQAPATANSKEEPLKVLLSVEQKTIVAPLPARATLHIHNAGQEALWLYRHARSKVAISRIEAAQAGIDEEPSRRGNRSSGGATLEVQLAGEGSQHAADQAQAEILGAAG